MDILVHPTRSGAGPATDAARRFTADEFEAMVRAGIINEAERLELIDGRLVAMSAKGNRHETVRNKLQKFWVRLGGDGREAWSEAPVRLALQDQPEPDVIMYPALIDYADLKGTDLLVLVEVADTTLSYDLKIKGPLYASYDVREYWVIDANALKTHVHRDPVDGQYRSIVQVPQDELLIPHLAPDMAVRLADLKLGWTPD